MTEYLFEIVWTALMLICIAIIGIDSWLHSKKLWEIIVDGETFRIATRLDINRKYHEIEFWDVMEACWRHFTYSRLEIHELCYREESQ